MEPQIIEYAVTVNLKEYQDMEMILLKGHLILEQTLNQIISDSVTDSKRIDSMRLMFYKKLELVMALNGSSITAVYPHLKEINRIRNKLAHELFFDKYHNELKKWACSVLGHTPKTIDSKKTYKNTVIKSFSYLAGLLIGVSEGIRATQGNTPP